MKGPGERLGEGFWMCRKEGKLCRQLRPTFTGSSTPRPGRGKHLLSARGFVLASDLELIEVSFGKQAL